MPNIADDFVAIRARLIEQSDPLAALVAERFRIEAESEEKILGLDDDETHELLDEADQWIGRLDDEIAGIVATSSVGIIGQVRLLRAICESEHYNDYRSDDCADRLIAAISAGIERLAGA